MDVRRDLEETERRLARLTDRYVGELVRGRTTRSVTTTYNARAGQLCQRRDELRRILKAGGGA